MNSEAYSSFVQNIQPFLMVLEKYAFFVNFALACISFIVNLFHFAIITRKSMRISLINVLMIGVTICDIFGMMTTIYRYLELTDLKYPECVTSDSYVKAYLGYTSWSFQKYFRRCNSWLEIFIASVRLIIIRRVSSCAEYQELNNLPKFKLDFRQFSENYQILIIQIYIALDVIISQFLPRVTFPILTWFLFYELRKLNKTRSLLQTDGVGEDREEKFGLSTKLITLLTITSFLSDAPIGCALMAKVFLQHETALIRFLTDLMIYFTIFSTAVSIFRPIMCYLMSSRYRSTARKLFLIENKRVNNSSENYIHVIPK